MTCPPEYGPPRCTAYAYVVNHGLMAKYGTMDWLFDIGRRAANEAHWRGLEEQKVWEGGGWEWYLVHTWPEEIFDGVIAKLEQQEKTAFADAATAQVQDVPQNQRPYPGYTTQDAGWGEGGVPWDGDDIRPY